MILTCASLLKITSGLPEGLLERDEIGPAKFLKEHIDQLWPVLTREPQDHIPWSSLLALPQSYIVPGGCFSETDDPESPFHHAGAGGKWSVYFCC